MKATVLNVEERISKNGKPYNKALLQVGDSVGFIFDFDCKCAKGATVELTVVADFRNDLKLTIK